MFKKVTSLGLYGLDAFKVEVEADISGGLPCFDIVGLPDAAVKESKDRVRSALKNSGFRYPTSRITINLAPGDVKKEGPIYDLPIMLAIMLADENIKFNANLDECAFIGSLSLGGEIQRINGVLPMVIKAKELGIKKIFVPKENSPECSAVDSIEAFGVSRISEIVEYFNDFTTLEPIKKEQFSAEDNSPDIPDFKDVKGQFEARRAIEIAAAGGHNILMIGSPGAGKSMLAKRIPSILPDMTEDEAIQTTKVHSIAGILPSDVAILKRRPFRSPHHTISPAGLAGGGTIPKPGEISLANNGVLFLDELPEFSKTAMEILRQPIEDGVITISRVSGTAVYPCNIMTVAAMNPCKCGYFGHPTRPCTCPPGAAAKYISKISYPLLDRFDIHVDVQPVEYDDLSNKSVGEPSSEIKKRVNAARNRQLKRFAGTTVTCNAKMDSHMTRQFCKMTPAAEVLLKKSFEKFSLSARAYDKILKVALTIADIDGFDIIDVPQISEAVQYRSLDKKYWGR